MSLGVNLSSLDLRVAYEAVQSGDPDTEWAVFTYDKGTNDLKVQAKGAGGLEELSEEFSDGRMQYAFVRVKDPNTELNKFVQINWCGDGVPEAKKGLFHTHSSAVAGFLKGTHVVISARNEADVAPDVILKRVADSSGSKYSVHREPPKRPEPIAAVGSTYKPIGTPNIAAMRANAPKDVIGKVGTAYTPARTELGNIRAPSQQPPPPTAARPVPAAASRPTPQPATAVPPPPPAASRPVPTASAPATSSAPPKPAEEDRIGPVGTAYTPVNLGPPKKLVNPFAQRQAEQLAAQKTSAPGPGAGAPKKLTWTERQALAKKQREEEEASSKAAMAGAAAAVAGAGAGV
ncbi:hypothetical protein FRB90_006425, partial [Tulasnella sp. 427]